jgi:ribosomal protein L24E
MYVFRTGAIKYYCSGRCYKNGIVVKRKINKKLVAHRSKTKLV